MTNVAVIGAGPAGLTAAYELTKAGFHVTVYEASDHVGGMARSISLWGQTVDIGPHRFFSKDQKVNRLWLEVAGSNYVMVNRLTRIYYKGQFFQYPLKPFEALQKLGGLESGLALGSYLAQQTRPYHGYPPHFEAWAIKNFGKRLYHHFFKSYTEKLWGMPADQLDPEFAVQRIKGLNLGDAVKHAFSAGKTQYRTLQDRFAYPLYGTGMIYQRMAAYIQSKGNEIHFSAPIKEVLTDENQKVRGLINYHGQVVPYDHVISSMPITHLVKALPSVPEAVERATQQLKFRNTILVYLSVADVELFPDNWLYIHSPHLKVGRITNFRNWSPALYGEQGNTILAMEFWCSFEDAFWSQSDEALIERATTELRQTGLIREAPVTDGYVYRIPRCYPVYEKGYKKHLDVVKGWLDQFSGLQAIGRYGAFNYTNQDHSILMGLLAAENVANAHQHDLWKINSEAQYQEDSVIGEEGLTYAATSE